MFKEVPKITKTSLQDSYIKDCINNNSSVAIFLVTGIRLYGKVIDFDDYTIKLSSFDKKHKINGEQLVNKNNITTMRVVPDVEDYGNNIEEIHEDNSFPSFVRKKYNRGYERD